MKVSGKRLAFKQPPALLLSGSKPVSLLGALLSLPPAPAAHICTLKLLGSRNPQSLREGVMGAEAALTPLGPLICNWKVHVYPHACYRGGRLPIAPSALGRHDNPSKPRRPKPDHRAEKRFGAVIGGLFDGLLTKV